MSDTDNNTTVASDVRDETRAEGIAEAATEAANTATPASAGERQGATSTDDTGAKRQRRGTRRPVSQAVVHMKVQLRSRHAQRTYRRGYSTASRALYTLSVILRIYATEAEAEQVNTYADEMLSSVHNELAAEIERMEKVAADNGIERGAVNYTVPEEHDVEVNSPRAGQYLGLIRQMDRFVSLIDVLWLSGTYTDAQHSAGSYQWHRRLVKLANRLRNLAQRSMAMTRRDSNEARRALVKEMLGDGADNDIPAIEDGDDDDEGLLDGDDNLEDNAVTPPAKPAARKRTTKAKAETPAEDA